MIRASRWRVPCVIAGHMHARLAYYLRMEWPAGVLQQLEEIWVDGEDRVREAAVPKVLDLT